MYIAASSKYSQAIFKKLNFDVLHEKDYEGYKGKDGSEFFKNMQEHKTVQVVLLDLSNFSISDWYEITGIYEACFKSYVSNLLRSWETAPKTKDTYLIQRLVKDISYKDTNRKIRTIFFIDYCVWILVPNS